MAAITELKNGSPFVNDRLTSYTTKHLVMLRKIQVVNDVLIRGIVTLRIACEGVQPSIMAASLRLSDTLMNPAT